MTFHVVGAGGEVQHLGVAMAEPVGKGVGADQFGLGRRRYWRDPCAALAEVLRLQVIQYVHLPAQLGQP